MKTKLLCSEDIQKIFQLVGLDSLMDEMISNLEEAFKLYSPSKIDVPARSGFNYSLPNVGLVEWMPLYEIGNTVTIKIVGYHPENPKENLPTILSSISQYDTRTGHLTGITDGVLLTALRTGAASALATDYLSHPESNILGLIGCGAQSVTQLHGISRIRDIKKVYYYDIDSETVNNFKERINVLGLDVDLIESTIEEIVQVSDILCTATSIKTGEGPLFNELAYQKHLHINAVGSDFPGKVEIPMDIINSALLFPDFIEQSLVEGEFQRLKRHQINCDLSDLIKDQSAYQSANTQTTVFDSTGHALEDHVAMGLFLKYAEEFQVGQEIDLEFIPENSKDPYGFINNHQLKQTVLTNEN